MGGVPAGAPPIRLPASAARRRPWSLVLKEAYRPVPTPGGVGGSSCRVRLKRTRAADPPIGDSQECDEDVGTGPHLARQFSELGP